MGAGLPRRRQIAAAPGAWALLALAASVVRGQSNGTGTNASDANSTVAAFRPNGPCVNCSALPDEFVRCDTPSDDQCDYSGQSTEALYDDVRRVSVQCVVLDGVTCWLEGLGCTSGAPVSSSAAAVADGTEAAAAAATAVRNFTRDNVPCVKYTGHNFLSTLLVSAFFGWVGADRFMLGYTSLGLAKLFTLGMLGTWWLVDLLLLASGLMRPADGSSWEPYY